MVPLAVSSEQSPHHLAWCLSYWWKELIDIDADCGEQQTSKYYYNIDHWYSISSGINMTGCLLHCADCCKNIIHSVLFFLRYPPYGPASVPYQYYRRLIRKILVILQWTDVRLKSGDQLYKTQARSAGGDSKLYLYYKCFINYMLIYFIRNINPEKCSSH